MSGAGPFPSRELRPHWGQRSGASRKRGGMMSGAGPFPSRELRRGELRGGS
jgi:hypothetical protein